MTSHPYWAWRPHRRPHGIPPPPQLQQLRTGDTTAQPQKCSYQSAWYGLAKFPRSNRNFLVASTMSSLQAVTPLGVKSQPPVGPKAPGWLVLEEVDIPIVDHAELLGGEGVVENVASFEFNQEGPDEGFQIRGCLAHADDGLNYFVVGVFLRPWAVVRGS
ncbi:hypothetical protein PG984_002940 [Apiospora sp. TS-2023a]